MSSNHLILCCPLLLPPSIFPSIMIFSNESVLCITWPKYWNFSFSICPSNDIQGWFPLGWTGWISLQSKRLSRDFCNTTVQKHQFFSAQLSLWSSSPILATAAKSLQSCLTLCDIIDGIPPGSRPWDSPGKNTGVGCHFLLQCMKVKSESEVAQLCPTLHDPMDCSTPGSSIP